MKIIKTKRYANISGDRDPYKIDFAHEEEKVKSTDTDSLFGALKDAIEASQVSVNAGKYFDQASVYRKELKNRGFSFEKQDEKLKGMKSLHTDRLNAVNETHGIWENMSDDKLKGLMQDDRHMA